MILSSNSETNEALPEGPNAQLQMGDVRCPQLLPILLGLTAVAFGALLYLTSYINFFFDEWDFISYDRPWQLQLFWLAHNEHWSTIPIFVWKLLFVLVGIRSHIPYEAVLLATHVAAVVLLFTLIRRRSGDLPAFAAALILLVLGSGATDIVWAFQIGWVGSVAFGLLAMLLLDGDPPFPSRVLTASAALVCSLMCSAVGLAFLAAVGVELLFDPRRRRFLLALIAPTLAFAEWFLAFGAGLPSTPGAPCPTCTAIGFSADIHSGPIGPDYFVSLARYVASGVDASAAGILGLPGGGAGFLLILAAFGTSQWVLHRGVQSWQIGMAAGVLVWFALTGLGRTQKVPATDSHYVYIGVVFLLPIIAEVSKQLPWGRLWRPLIVGALAFSLFGNIVQLRDAALAKTGIMRTEDAELQTVEVFRGAPDMALHRGLDDSIMPQLDAGPYLSATDELGSPVPRATLATLRQLPPEAVDGVMVNLFGAALRVDSDSSRPVQGLPCRNIESQSSSDMNFRVGDGQSIALQSTLGGDAVLYLGFLAPPNALEHVQLMPATRQLVYLPDTGTPIVWQLRLTTAAPLGTVRVCGGVGGQIATSANTIGAEARSGSLDPGWSSVVDPTARGGRAARASGGTFVSWEVNMFGTPTMPRAGAYDVWYRVRVGSSAGHSPEMLLGVWDDQAPGSLGSNLYQPDQIGTAYLWVKVAAGIVPTPGHNVQFIAAFMGRLSTDWYIDSAVMVPSGSTAPL